MMVKSLPGIATVLVILGPAAAQYPEWKHSGSIYLLTTPEGADLPASASEADFPVLVRLHKDLFDFSQAKANGEDIRFSAKGKTLAYQVEEWDAAKGVASIWVRIPVIKGDARQEIKLYWGKEDAASESSGSAVFNAEDGFVTVLHLDEGLKDEVGTIAPKDAGSTVSDGMIGKGRHLEPGKGIDGGDHVTSYPFGDNPFTSEAWVRIESAGAACFG